MRLLTAGIVLMLICIVLIWREPRRFRNALLFFVALLLLVQGMINVVVRSTYARYTTYNILFYFIVPAVSVVMSGFLIYNGFVMMKKEGRRLQNSSVLLAKCIHPGIYSSYDDIQKGKHSDGYHLANLVSSVRIFLEHFFRHVPRTAR